MILNDWRLVAAGTRVLAAPEYVSTAPTQLKGCVVGNFTFGGSYVRTSFLTGLDIDSKLMVTTWSGSEYELGEPRKEYELMFPNAKNRLLKALLNCWRET